PSSAADPCGGCRAMSFDLAKMTAGLPPAWAGFPYGLGSFVAIRELSANHAVQHLLAAVQLARYLADGVAGPATPKIRSRSTAALVVLQPHLAFVESSLVVADSGTVLVSPSPR